MMLNQEEKKTIEKVVNEMLECNMFNGKYDAKNGNIHFVYGISTVMEYLSNLVSEEYYNTVSQTFCKNLVESRKSC